MRKLPVAGISCFLSCLKEIRSISLQKYSEIFLCSVLHGSKERSPSVSRIFFVIDGNFQIFFIIDGDNAICFVIGGDVKLFFVIACIALFNYSQIWLYNLGHIFIFFVLLIFLYQKQGPWHILETVRNINTMPFQPFEFHI